MLSSYRHWLALLVLILLSTDGFRISKFTTESKVRILGTGVLAHAALNSLSERADPLLPGIGDPPSPVASFTPLIPTTPATEPSSISSSSPTIPTTIILSTTSMQTMPTPTKLSPSTTSKDSNSNSSNVADSLSTSTKVFIAFASIMGSFFILCSVIAIARAIVFSGRCGDIGQHAINSKSNVNIEEKVPQTNSGNGNYNVDSHDYYYSNQMQSSKHLEEGGYSPYKEEEKHQRCAPFCIWLAFNPCSQGLAECGNSFNTCCSGGSGCLCCLFFLTSF